MRIATLVVGAVTGLAVAGWFVLMAGMWATGTRSALIESQLAAFGVITLAWLFGVALTWELPKYSGGCYAFATFIGALAAFGAQRIAPSGYQAVVAGVVAAIAATLALMIFLAQMILGPSTTNPGLTEEMIETAMAKADQRTCFGDDRCYAFPYRVEHALPTCTAKGRCKVGWISKKSGRESWDVWLELSTGLVKLIPKANA